MFCRPSTSRICTPLRRCSRPWPATTTWSTLVNEKIRFMLLSGAHVDVDTLDLLREIFPHTTITMAFGSTMILSQAITRRSDDVPVRLRSAQPLCGLLGGGSR